MPIKIDIDREKLVEFCRRWMITELAFFGSVLREDFHPDSDVDVLVSFSPDAKWTLLDHVEMQDELKELLERNVDLLTRRGIERSLNYIRRKDILDSVEVVYAA